MLPPLTIASITTSVPLAMVYDDINTATCGCPPLPRSLSKLGDRKLEERMVDLTQYTPTNISTNLRQSQHHQPLMAIHRQHRQGCKPYLKPLDFSSSSRDPFGFDCCTLDLFMLFYFPFFHC